MNISLNPSYLCNFRCSFCYLTPEQLGDKKRAQISEIDLRLAEIISREPITHIDLYGGEIAILDEVYLEELFVTIRRYYTGQINVITNLSKISPVFMRDDVDISVSYDFYARQKHVEVYTNMAMLNKDIAVLILASKTVIDMNVEDMIEVLNGLHNVKSVEIKPYSTNQANTDSVSFRDFEKFVMKWIESKTIKNFHFENQSRIQNSLSGTYNAFSNNHIYITPDACFAVLDFDEHDNEKFTKLASLDEYYAWASNEIDRVSKNTICSVCPFLGRCLTEHYRDVKDTVNSCNGFKMLLEQYERYSSL